MGFLAFFFGMYSGPSGSSGSSGLLSSVLFGPTCRGFTPLKWLRTAAEGACSRKHWHTAGVCVRSIQRGTTWFTPGMGWAKLICNSSTVWWQLFPLSRHLRDSRVTSKQEVLCSKDLKKILYRLCEWKWQTGFQILYISLTRSSRSLRRSWNWWVLPLNADLTAEKQGAAIFVRQTCDVSVTYVRVTY